MDPMIFVEYSPILIRGFGLTILAWLLGTVFGIGMAATILVAQSVGAKDVAHARRIVGTSASFFFAVSAVFAVFGWIFVGSILGALGTPADALRRRHCDPPQRAVARCAATRPYLRRGRPHCRVECRVRNRR